MTMCVQFSVIWHVRPYCPGLVLLRCREGAYFNYQIVHGLPPPPFSHPDFLECWYLRHKSTLSVSTQEDPTWGISGRYLAAEDAFCVGLV